MTPVDRLRQQAYPSHMSPEELADGIKTILSHSPAFPGSNLVVDIIANPVAGGFKLKRYTKLRDAELKQLVGKAQKLQKRKESVEVRLHLTEREGHAADIMQELIDLPSGTHADGHLRADARQESKRHIIITTGGDGTSLEAAERIALLPEPEKDRFGILRLPLGTGNDGSEGRDLITALGRFLGPVKFARRPAVRVTPASAGGGKPRYAFNIASIGLDAYVAEMTNKVKAKISGDFYKFWVDIASVFYDKVYKVAPMHVKLWNNLGKLVRDETKEQLLVVFGVSGYRQYGSNKPILPSKENVVLVSQTSLLRKMAIKTPIETGKYQGLPEVESYSASKAEVEYDKPILLQCDGETQLLTQKDFPLTFEVVRDLYNVVVPESSVAPAI